MMKTNKLFKSPAVTVVALVAGVGLLLFSVLGTARAALDYRSNIHSIQVQMDDIGLSLLEKGAQDKEAKVVSHRNYDKEAAAKDNATEEESWDQEVPGQLLTGMLAENETVALNRNYKEELSVQNTGTINTYVRVKIYKYWKVTDEEGNTRKLTTLSPDLIHLSLDGKDLYDEDVTKFGDWLKDKDEDANSDERVVLYYDHLLNSQDVSSLFADTISIDNSIAKQLTQTTTTEEDKDGNKTTTIVTTYDYDGIEFCLEARADAVQEHNAEDAIKSAWGLDVTIDEEAKTLALGKAAASDASDEDASDTEERRADLL